MAKKNHKYQQQVKVDWKQVSKSDVAPTSNDQAEVRLSFQYAQPGDHHCLSHCHGDDVRQVVECFRRLTTMQWIQVLQTSTKERGQKTGLHWTVYSDAALTVKRPANVSGDHTICGIRAGDKFRIFGFRFGAYFYVLWFDPEHKVCPAG